MRVEVQQLPQSQVQLQIEIDPEMLGQAVNKAYQRLAGRYTVPGFRPGKAPRAVLERAIGPEMLMSEAADICMNDAYAQAIKDNHLHPLGFPDVQSPKSDEIDPEKPLSFTATVYVRSHPQLGDYRALQIAPEIPDVQQDDIEQVLQRVQDEQASWEPVEDRPAESGDMATLRLLATVGDETLVDQDNWEYRLNAEESPNLPIPGLSQQLIGLHVGDSKDLTIDLPGDYKPEEYAGKQMALHFEVLRLTQRVAPSIDDEFARTLGDFESIEQVRGVLRTSLENQTRQQAMDAYVDNVVRQVVAQATVEAPPPLVDEEVDEMMRQLQENVERERRISMDAYTRIVGKSVEELREEARPTAEQRVRTNLVLDEVAEAEDVHVPQSAIEEQLRAITSDATLTPKRRRELLASESLRDRIERRLRRNYTINRLLEITRPPEPEVVAQPEPAAAIEGELVAQPTELTAPTEPAGAVAGAQDNPSGQQNEQEN